MSEPTRRVIIRWTETAKECLKKLPAKVQRGLIDKADELLTCTDPTRAHKPLTGPLGGYYRITCGRYRAIYSVSREDLPSGDVLETITITFVAAGKRSEHSKDDVYKVAQRLIEMQVLDPLPEFPRATPPPPPPKKIKKRHG